MEGTVTWLALVSAINLLLNSLTFLLVLAQNLRLTSYITTSEWREHADRRERGID